MPTVGSNDQCHFGDEEDEKEAYVPASLTDCFSFGRACAGFLPHGPLEQRESRDAGSGERDRASEGRGREGGRQNEKKEEEAEGNADGRDETAVVESSDKNLPTPSSFEQ